MSRLLTRLSVVILTLACVAIGSAVAGLEFSGSDGSLPYVTKADFDQAFVDVTAQPRRSAPTVGEMIESAARSAPDATNVNRAGKSDRLPVLDRSNDPGLITSTTTVRKNGASSGLAKPSNGPPDTASSQGIIDAIPAANPIPEPYCEPVASPFADPALSRIDGHCFG